MAVYSMRKTQKIPVDPGIAWNFFATPDNLATLTPARLGFRTISKYQGEKMYPGQIIEYKIKPMLGIPLYWMTEITHIREGEYFVDEQRYGPYSMWHHQHHFKPIAGGVEMTDIVHYKNPFWLIGDVANALFVRKQLEEIFAYRFRKVEEIFGSWV